TGGDVPSGEERDMVPPSCLPVSAGRPSHVSERLKTNERQDLVVAVSLCRDAFQRTSSAAIDAPLSAIDTAERGDNPLSPCRRPTPVLLAGLESRLQAVSAHRRLKPGLQHRLKAELRTPLCPSLRRRGAWPDVVV